jgi:DnaK suppressor protein
MVDCVNTEHLKKLLLQQQHDLLQVRESGSRAAGTVTLDQTSVGRLSRMDALQSQAMLQEAVRRREQSLRDIGDALRRTMASVKSAGWKLLQNACSIILPHDTV